jgi:hypothetical protein
MIVPSEQGGPAPPPTPALSRANSGVSRGPPGHALSRASSNASMGSANSEKQRSVGGLSVALPSLFKRKQKDKDILALYDSGDLRELMEGLLISEKERGVWLKLWLDIDLGFKNSVGYQAFIEYFLFEENEFTRKVFEIMNSDLSATVTLREFVQFCLRYLVVDRDGLQEFSFRLLMRQSSRFNAHSVIDAVDLKYFIVNRYGAADSKDTHKASLALLREMDNNEGLGLTLAQFKRFSKTCHSVETFSTKFLMHIRNFVLGNEFWVRRSRLLKKSVLTGLASLTPMKRVNIDAEIYMNLLGLPVVDSKGRGIRMVEAPPPGGEGEGGVYPAPSGDESYASGDSRAVPRRVSSREGGGGGGGGGSLSRQGSAVSSMSRQMSGTMSRQPSGISLGGGGGGGGGMLSRQPSQESGGAGAGGGSQSLSRADSTRSMVSNLSAASSRAPAARLWQAPFDHDR